MKKMQQKVLIIAEAGVNHNGDVNLAKELIDAAVDSGADAVKFQTYISEMCISGRAPKAAYQNETTGNNESQLEMLKRYELPFAAFTELKEYCEKKRIIFMSTPFDSLCVDFLYKIGMDIFKIPSGEITNYPLLKQIGNLHRKVIMSTGMSVMKEINQAIDILRGSGTTDITLLHCNSQYPTPITDVNLLAMVSMHEETGLPVGYSDHTQGIEVPIAATAMGATVIEKHFTLDKHMEGPDHRASLEPCELRQMVEGIRKIEQALGTGIKEVSLSERENINIARKSIVAACDINKGEIFTEKNLTTKRPGTGISPMRWEEIIGAVADRDYKADAMIWV